PLRASRPRGRRRRGHRRIVRRDGRGPRRGRRRDRARRQERREGARPRGEDSLGRRQGVVPRGRGFEQAGAGGPARLRPREVEALGHSRERRRRELADPVPRRGRGGVRPDRAGQSQGRVPRMPGLRKAPGGGRARRLDHQRRIHLGPVAAVAGVHLLGDEGRGAQHLQEPGARVGPPGRAREHPRAGLLPGGAEPQGPEARPRGLHHGPHADGALRRGRRARRRDAAPGERAGGLVHHRGGDRRRRRLQRDEHLNGRARMRPINRFLVRNGLLIAGNPCVSPDFCLDWPALRARLAAGAADLASYPKSRFETAAGAWTVVEDPRSGDCAWKLEASGAADPGLALADGVLAGPLAAYFPATWENLLRLKNLVQERDPGSTIFPTAAGRLGRSTLGVGARFTTLHWPAVEWAMSALDLGLTANQNSIPRELVYDTDAMLEGRLESVPFPFIGTSVPEGHQGQSVEGMSHGCVLSKLRTGFHRRRIAWSFNADHQPIGGAFDSREGALVRGCLLASYITFDLSPELALRRPAGRADIDAGLRGRVGARVAAAGLAV